MNSGSLEDPGPGSDKVKTTRMLRTDRPTKACNLCHARVRKAGIPDRHSEEIVPVGTGSEEDGWDP